jgi:NAD(P)-dependent dehydrogenase (short-subunit alcohol dehydrogenase family)
LAAEEPVGAPPPMNLVISGSSTGIGKFLADSLEKKGHAVCRLARSPQPGFALTCDVSDWRQVEKCAAEVAQRWEFVDGLICCAGSQGPIGPAMEADPEQWRRTIAVNLEGTFFTLRAFHHLLRKAPRRAKIIGFSGGGSTSPRPKFTAYGVSKTAVVRLVETLADEWREQPMDVNAIAPGAIFTRMTEEVLTGGPQVAGQAEYDRALKQPRDNAPALAKVLGLVEFLLSEKSDGISGKLISAPWDPWTTLDQHRQELAKSDIYTLRRIVPGDRGQKWT